MEEAHFRKYPHIYLLMLGQEGIHAPNITFHHSMRNTINLLYLERKIDQTGVRVYRRCLYCNEGELSIDDLFSGKTFKSIPLKTLFPDQFANMMGKNLRFVNKEYGALTVLGPPDKPGGIDVELLDSMNKVIMDAMGAKLNFTYHFRLPIDNEWGRALDQSWPGGRWSGVVGTMQREEGDISNLLTYLLARSRVMDYMQVWFEEPLLIITSKPLPLSLVLSFVRPMTYNVYAVLISVLLFMIWGFWQFSQLESMWLGIKNMGLYDSFYLTYGILIEEIRPEKPKKGGASILLVSWLWFCIIITTLYKSSLRAHFIIPLMSKPIESFEDLVERNYTWGMGPVFGSVFQWMSTSETPIVKVIFKDLELDPWDEQFKKAQVQNHAVIWLRSYLINKVAKDYTDILGDHPYHLATSSAFTNWGMSWGMRQGAPFRWYFSNIMQWLVDTGHINHYLKVYQDLTVRKTRIKKRKELNLDDIESNEVNDAELALNMNHLQGAFFLLFGFHLLAFLAFLYELVKWNCSKDSVSETGMNVSDGRTNNGTEDGDSMNFPTISYHGSIISDA